MHALVRTVEFGRGLYPFTLVLLRFLNVLTLELLNRRVFMDLHGSFARFDENNDGSISRAEFEKVPAPRESLSTAPALRLILHDLCLSCCVRGCPAGVEACWVPA